MKIARISWTNYKGLDDNEIIADGSDVLISGRNGTGKTSIASAIPFVLFGDDKDKVKQFDNGLLPTDDGLIHGAEITFDDGTTLRREYFWRNSGNAQKFFINGEKVSVKEFDMKVYELTKNCGKLLFNPFTFCEMKKDDRRALLLKIFGDVTDEQILSTDEFADVKNFLGGKTSSTFIDWAQRQLKTLDKSAKAIPAKLTELQLQLSDKLEDYSELEKQLAEAQLARQKISFEPSPMITELETQINNLRDERAKLKADQPKDYQSELNREKRHADYLTTQINRQRFQLKNLNEQLIQLRNDWHRVHDSQPGKCPTCGQVMPVEQFTVRRDKELDRINKEGNNLRYVIIPDVERAIDDLTKELHEVTAQIDSLTLKLQSQATENALRSDKIAKLEQQIQDLTAQKFKLQADEKSKRDELFMQLDVKISDLTSKISVAKAIEDSRYKTTKRIEELRAEEKSLNSQIAQLEHQIQRAREFQRRKISLVENRINSQFGHVTFKLFDTLITTGEIKPTCEPMLNGVPYVALSKGEKLKAALDIFRTLQRYYGVEMPLIIDDAESYTMNSLLELPNQKFFFRVEECDLVVKVEMRCAA